MSKQVDKPAPADEMGRLQATRAELVARLGNQEREAADLTNTTDAIVDARTKLFAIRATIADVDHAIVVEQDRLTRQKIDDLQRRIQVVGEGMALEHKDFAQLEGKAIAFWNDRSPMLTEAEMAQRAEVVRQYMLRRRMFDAENHKATALVFEQASLRESLRG